MKRLNNQTLVKQLIARNESYINIVENKFMKLSEKQLNQKPSKDKWSIAECLIHIIKADEIYLKQFEVKVLNFKSSVFRDGHMQEDHLNYKPGCLGNWFAKSIVPKNGKLQSTMKSLKVMDPQVNIELLSKEFSNVNVVITEFIKQQRRINELIKKAEIIDLGKIKIQTAIPLVKIKLGDAFRFVVGHNERHIWQAEKVYEVLK